MSLVVPDEGEILLLSYMLNKTPTDDVVLRLFKNNFTPSENTTLAGGIGENPEECTESGYPEDGISLIGSGWAITLGAMNVVTAEHTEQTFHITEAVTVYGYYITDADNTTVLTIERFSEPGELPTEGGRIYVTPVIILS